MAVRPRSVLPELLDELEPDDPRARRSRADLRRIHVAMGTAGIVQRALQRLPQAAAPRRILELGAGDGTLLLRVARRLGPAWRGVDLTLLDRVDLLDRGTCDDYEALGWRAHVSRGCATEWAGATCAERYDVCVATLFLHHFAAEPLRALLTAVAERADALVAVEPRRGLVARLGSRLVTLLGANAVTRADAATSVDAGFAADELTRCWPGADHVWQLREYAAGPFAHCFVAARRRSVRGPSHAPQADRHGR